MGNGLNVLSAAVIEHVGRLRAGFRLDLRGAFLPMPAMALLLVGGTSFGLAEPASIAAGAAFSVGFGATKRLWHSRWNTMALTAVGMTIVAFFGTLIGHDPRMALAATAVMGGLCGALIQRDTNLWWVWLQIVIAFLLALRFPGSVTDAAGRASLVLLGAVLQIGAVWGMLRTVDEAKTIMATPPGPVTRLEIALHALRAAVCITTAVLVSRATGIAHGYWAPMTAMLVLKPGLRDTSFRGLERLGGTLAGIALATLILHVLPPPSFWLAWAAVVSSGLAFGLQQARYAFLSTAITSSVVLMIALAGGQVAGAEHDRVLATLIGGAVALAGAAIAPRRLAWKRQADDRE